MSEESGPLSMRRHQDHADSWRTRAYAYADRILMPREHGAYATVPCLVLDPFGGAGTTGLVALQEGRDYLLIEAKPGYCDVARRRIAAAQRLPLFEPPTPAPARAKPEEARLF
jgi:hypothetical protein